MGAMFRSEEMVLAQVFLQPETAYQIISKLGEEGTVQFRDLNENVSAFQRQFVNEVRRCDEMERKLRYIETEVRKDNVSIPDVIVIPKAPNPRETIDLEAHLEKTEGEIKELSESAVTLKSDYLELTEIQQVLEKTKSFFQEKEEGLDSIQKALSDDGQSTIRGKLGFVAGVIKREKVVAFEKVLWRVSRQNVFFRQTEVETLLEDPETGNEIPKSVFIVFFQGEQLKNRINKVCNGFGASLYPCPTSATEREEMMKQIRTRIEDLNVVLNQTQDYRQRVLVSVAKELQNWTVMVRKMKAIFHTLNFFNLDVTKKCLIGECWIPSKDVPFVQTALSIESTAVGSPINSFLNIINTSEPPPTFNRTNKFSRGFQNLIDAYGVASYREVNPALYTIITFPFLFAIMFGDAGHGVILLLFALYMVLFEEKLQAKKINSEIWNIFFGGRYIILLMGFFSIYTGLIYNDVFSKSANIFGSSWHINYTREMVQTNNLLTLDPKVHYSDVPYPFGMDPVWQLAKNKIIFLNGYKMKLSIIFGVIHMAFGVCMGVVNYVHFRKYYSIVLEFLPQILFLLLLFFWMVVMMFMKWIMFGAYKTDLHFSTACAPSVLIYFINMMLFKHTKPPKGCYEYMFDFQEVLQLCLVVIAVLCIPVMLLGKPLYIKFTSNKHKKHSSSNGYVNEGMEMTSDIIEQASSSKSHSEEHEEEFSEIMIHQAIHTIEYVLSTISHTASYLRLWALSLAHAQLSEVLWNMVLQQGLTDETYVGAVKLFIAFAIWAVFTLGILVMMEGLSAFLHTLRLHWVEFMSKFYEGLGYQFHPFSFKIIMAEEDNADD